MAGFLLDTNIISELAKPRPEQKVLSWLERTNESLLFLSVLTLGEISKGISLLPANDNHRSLLQIWLEHDVTERFAGRVLAITPQISLSWGRMSGSLQMQGKNIGVIDCLLAATVFEEGLILVTRNSNDFANLDIETFNPWTS